MFITYVGAPDKVLPNISFNIKWRVLHITIPFIKFTYYYKLIRDGEVIYKKLGEKRPWFFFGFISDETTDKLENDGNYILEVY